MPRCPNGTHKNRKTGECESVAKKTANAPLPPSPPPQVPSVKPASAVEKKKKESTRRKKTILPPAPPTPPPPPPAAAASPSPPKATAAASKKTRTRAPAAAKKKTVRQYHRNFQDTLEYHLQQLRIIDTKNNAEHQAPAPPPQASSLQTQRQMEQTSREIKHKWDVNLPKLVPVSDNVGEVEERLQKKMDALVELGKLQTAENVSRKQYTSNFFHFVANILLCIRYGSKCFLHDKHLIKVSSENNGRNEINQKMFDSAQELSESLLDCIQRGEELIVFPIALKSGKDGGHANLVIYRADKKRIERFDPHGSALTERNMIIDRVLKEMFEEKMKPYMGDRTPMYIDPFLVCPVRGFQSLECESKILRGKGFCGIWMLFMTEMVIMNPELTTQEVIRVCMQIAKRDPDYLKYVILGYTMEVEKLMAEFLKLLEVEENFDLANIDTLNKKQNKILKYFAYLLSEYGSKRLKLQKWKKLKSSSL